MDLVEHTFRYHFVHFVWPHATFPEVDRDFTGTYRDLPGLFFGCRYEPLTYGFSFILRILLFDRMYNTRTGPSDQSSLTWVTVTSW